MALLTVSQLEEFSTNIYDELLRRKGVSRKIWKDGLSIIPYTVLLTQRFPIQCQFCPYAMISGQNGSKRDRHLLPYRQRLSTS